jgi:predicted metalloprotease with PDZ domain
MRGLFVRIIVIAVFLLSLFNPHTLMGQVIGLEVDLSEAPKNIFHSKMTFPAKPGVMTLVYPKWIPGNHRPSGPIANFTGLRVEARGKGIPWRRDDVDMYAFHIDVPADVSEVTIWADTITIDGSAGASGASASSKLLDLNWNQVLIYQAESASDDVRVKPSIKLPPNWKFATALAQAQQQSDQVAFQEVSLTTLVDSPLIAGEHFREVLLQQPGHGALQFLDLVGETEHAIEASDADLKAYQKLIDEASALFGAQHFRQYHFLLTLSDEVGHHGVEHHESSDNSVAERMFSDPNLHLLEAGLLPHEYVHSWNGKYRRPAGLATRNYQDPMRGDLLWIYEGMTEYLGDVLAARSGLFSEEQYREALASTAASLEYRRGRTWRSLGDTARSVQILRLMGPHWESWRRSLDYYPEGELVWLEVDSTIRQLTKGQKSLDDFCKAFHGGESGAPKVFPYTLDDVIKTLNSIAPNDWATLLQDLVEKTSTHAPLGGIERGGWKLVYSEIPNQFMAASEKVSGGVDLSYSLGMSLTKAGEVEDVIPDSAAARAGLAPRMKILAVNERRYNREEMLDAIREAAKNHRAMDLLIENSDFVKSHSINYFDGVKYPHLERVEGQPDILTEIIRARTP